MKRIACIALAVLLTACATPSPTEGWTTLIDGAKGLDTFDRVGEANWSATDGAVQASAGILYGHWRPWSQLNHVSWQTHMAISSKSSGGQGGQHQAQRDGCGAVKPFFRTCHFSGSDGDRSNGGHDCD